MSITRPGYWAMMQTSGYNKELLLCYLDVEVSKYVILNGESSKLALEHAETAALKGSVVAEINVIRSVLESCIRNVDSPREMSPKDKAHYYMRMAVEIVELLEGKAEEVKQRGTRSEQ